MYRNSLNILSLHLSKHFIKMKEVGNGTWTCALTPNFQAIGVIICHILTCFMAVTVITKKRGRPLVTGEVGVSIINWKKNAEPGVERFQQIKGEIETQSVCRQQRSGGTCIKQEVHTTSLTGKHSYELHIIWKCEGFKRTFKCCNISS